MMRFSKNFLWGVATSCYQIEGAVAEDGRLPSIWDDFSHTQGKTANGETGDVACDHYHRYREDVALMKSLGLQAYRFSTAWPRILPNGRGPINQKGLDFYSRLVDELLGAEIRPFITLYHWDLPLGLHGPLGWTFRDTAYAFAEYADVVSRHLGDRVSDWITLNEPWCSSMLSHQLGIHAPGVKDWYTALKTAHHLLLAHGLAIQTLRTNVPSGEHGITLNFEPSYPATDSPEDYTAARIWDGYYNRWFLDPVLGRDYPADMTRYYSERGYLPNGLDFVLAGDLETVSTPVDFIGVNNYTRHYAHGGESLDEFPFPDHVPPDELTAMNWEVFPQGLSDLLCRLHFEYKVPKLYVTENGCSYPTGPDERGRVADVKRIDYLERYIGAVQNAIQCGAPVQGYFQWSFMDNYEWSLGYTQRFGIVHVDYATQQRTLKDSAYWFKQLITNSSRNE